MLLCMGASPLLTPPMCHHSQPPLLSMMVGAVYEATQDQGFLAEAFAALETEHSYWTRPPKAVRVAAADGSVHSLARYYADTVSPRPESYRHASLSARLPFILGPLTHAQQLLLGGVLPCMEHNRGWHACREDTATAAGCKDAGAAAALYRELASAAESGWDFSSRWMADPDDVASMRTTRVIPADLNAFLCRMEADMQGFAKAGRPEPQPYMGFLESTQSGVTTVSWYLQVLGDTEKADFYQQAHLARRQAMTTLMLDMAYACWRDLLLGAESGQLSVCMHLTC